METGFRISRRVDMLRWAVCLQPNSGTLHRGIPREGGWRPGVIWKEARPGQGWTGHSWCLWGGCAACLGSDQGQACGTGCLESWQAFPVTRGLTGPLGPSSGPGTMSHRCGTADEPALDTQGKARLVHWGRGKEAWKQRTAWVVPPPGHLCSCSAIPLSTYGTRHSLARFALTPLTLTALQCREALPPSHLMGAKIKGVNRHG